MTGLVAVPPTSGGPEEWFPVSAEQAGLLLIEQVHPDTAVHNVPVVLTLRGQLDVAALRRAVCEVVSRHESLRTTFRWEQGRAEARVHTAGEPGHPVTDLIPQVVGSDADEVVLAEARRPLDLLAGPVLRVRLLRRERADDTGVPEHLLVLVVHHAVVDGWSLDLIHDELGLLYDAFAGGVAPQLDPPGPSYREHVAARPDGAPLDADIRYWRAELADPPMLHGLPTDRPRPVVLDLRGGMTGHGLGPDLGRAVRDWSRDRAVTPYVTLLAAFAALLGRAGGDTDVVIGSPFAGRLEPGAESVVGHFVTTLVHRADLTGAPGLTELTDRLQDKVLGAFDHYAVPFDRVVGEVVRDRDPSHHPLVQVSFGVEGAPAVPKLSDLEVGRLDVHNGCAKFDLSWVVVVDGDDLTVRVEYAERLFDAATVERLAGRYRTLLTAALAAPDRPFTLLPMLDEDEADRAIAQGRGEVPGDTAPPRLHTLVAGHARQDPDAPAVRHGAVTTSYRELDRRAGVLAGVLREHSVGPETLVGVMLDRSPLLVVAILAIWRAGGAYVPLDPDQPDERLRFVVADTGLPLVLSDRDGVDDRIRVPVLRVDGPADEPDGAAPEDEAGDRDEDVAGDLAYVIYTSGSTGRPKGTLVEHTGLANLVVAQTALFDDLDGARVLQFSRVTFDASMWEIAMALGHGATLCFPVDAGSLSGRVLAEEIRRYDATHVTVPPSVLASLPDEPLGLRTVVSAGEDMPADLADRLARRYRTVNAYGPTETTVCATAGRVRAGDGRPGIGHPIGNVEAHVLDAGGRPLPPGTVGELHVGGPALARGYLGRPRVTADRFVPHPFADRPGQRLYRTGDLARRTADGALEFVGRSDRQVKVRGFRIEPGEVEQALVRCPRVGGAVVTVPEDRGGRRLVAYVCPEPDVPAGLLDPDQISAFLRGVLPGYMVPSPIVVIEAIPLTAHGKVDQAALPAVGRGRDHLRNDHAPPRGAREEELARMWSDVLGVPGVGATDDFFALGGNSVDIVALRDRIEQRWGTRIPVSELFRMHNVRLLAALLGADTAHTPTVPEEGAGRATRRAATRARKARIDNDRH